MARRPPALDEFLSSSVQGGGQMMILITNMGQAIHGTQHMDADPETIEAEIVAILGRRLGERADLPHDEDMRVAAEVLRWATAAIGDELFGSQPGPADSNWVPEVRLRLRSLDDSPLPLEGELPPPHGELLN
jgi:hypothetical protein